MRSLGLTDRAFKLSTLALVLACSQEKKRDPGEPTPFDLYVARERLKGGFRTPADTSRSPPVNITTGDADHDFLRAMSNHHKNVIVLADAALEANTHPDMESLIRQLEERHAHELDAMTSILRKTYKDAFISSPSAQTKATAGTLRQPGSDYRRLFLDAALKAEEEGSRLADFYLIRTKRADIDRLAEEIKTNESQDLVAMRKRLGRGGQAQ
ncbi:MAG: DUF305 domain-containing protein [Gemmatimonadota bacterium]|nr:DUF305 domain-containing protein [Gemmatimonadota bacterium]